MVGMATAERAGVWPQHVDGEWTVEMLESLPDNGLRYEIIDGTLLVSPSPRPRHQATITGLVRLLLPVCPPEMQVFVAPLDWRPDQRTSLEPDVLVIRRDRVFETHIGDPELIIEVTSPSTARIDRGLKLDRYAEGGIGWYWIADPGGGGRSPALEVYELVGGRYRLPASASGDRQLIVERPFPITVIPSELVAG